MRVDFNFSRRNRAFALAICRAFSSMSTTGGGGACGCCSGLQVCGSRRHSNSSLSSQNDFSALRVAASLASALEDCASVFTSYWSASIVTEILCLFCNTSITSAKRYASKLAVILFDTMLNPSLGVVQSSNTCLSAKIGL